MNKNTKPILAAAISFVVAGAVFCAIAGISLVKVIIGVVVALIAAFVAYNMAKGVDTSKKAPTQKKFAATGDAAADELISKGQELLRQIRSEDDKIPDPELSAKIVQLEGIATDIFTAVSEEPSRASKLRRFMNYYLPTTLKMLTNYRKIDTGKITGQSAQDAKKQIEEAMDVVLTAFNKQKENIYQDDMLDITTDVEVLETMLKADGLLGSDVK